jgi:transposase
MTARHRWRRRVLHEQLVFLETQLAKLEARLQAQLSDYQEAVGRCTTIPGLGEGVAANLSAEVGVNMAPLPSAQPLASWAGICPGNHQSAGKRLSGKPRKGSAWLRRGLCQAAWAASHTKERYLAARFHRLAARKGKKRAIVAVAHTILVSLYPMLKTKQPYRELGADFLDRRHAEQVKRYLLKRLERLGVQGTVRSAEGTAALPACATIFEGAPRKDPGRRYRRIYLLPRTTHLRLRSRATVPESLAQQLLRPLRPSPVLRLRLL